MGLTENLKALNFGVVVGAFLLYTNRIFKAFELLKECIFIVNNMCKAMGEENDFVRIMYISVYYQMFRAYEFISDHTSAIKCGTEILGLLRKANERYKEGRLSFKLGRLCEWQNKYEKAKEFYMNALRISAETRDKELEVLCYENLGTVFLSLSKYDKAEEYLQKSLQIQIENGDKEGEASVYANLGSVFQYLGKYHKAQEYLQKALQIQIEIGDKKGEASVYGNLGVGFQQLGKYDKAEEYLQKSLQIHIEIGDKNGKARAYGNLGTVFQYLGKYDKAEEYLHKSLQIQIEIGDKNGEASAYGNLGVVCQHLGKYDKAEEYLQKSLQIRIEIGNKNGEASAYGNLGTVFRQLGKYDKAEEYLQKSLQIRIEIGDKNGEASAYGNLGRVFHYLGKYDKAEEFLHKALQIQIEIGDKNGEASAYGNLGALFKYVGKYEKAEEYLQKSLQISIEIGDKYSEAANYVNLGHVFQQLGKYDKAEEFLQKGLQITTEIGDKSGEAAGNLSVGSLYISLGEYSKAKTYHEKALSLACEIGDIELQFQSHLSLTLLLFLSTGNTEESVPWLIKSIENYEKLQTFLKGHDDFQISTLDVHVRPFKLLSALLSFKGKFSEALYVEELARARALADMMSTKYNVEQEISVNPQSWVGIERMLGKEIVSACLYISCQREQLFLWIIKANKPVVFRRRDINDCFSSNGARNADEVFGDISLRNFPPLLTQGHCEDRSLFPSNTGCLTPSRPLEEDEEQCSESPGLTQCYNMIIDPVADLLDQPEIIIVPEGPVFKVPFAALKDENEKFLSESFRIRIAPSLRTLKLIQDCPADYHSQTGALIIGDPQVGDVIYKGDPGRFSPLPCAREEAKMIGRLLGVQPLIGEQATKEAVLRDIHSVSLIHFAAHGNAERGEIALAPPRPFNGTPLEEHYLLTMAEVAKVRLKAKLVILSCCHSAEGEIRSEGVVGIARAFLGSGARSVLVALWAIEDEATMQFMSRFYEHLVGGESASESVHQAMTWMRSNGFSNVRQWAPFMLIGDNVTFDFRK